MPGAATGAIGRACALDRTVQAEHALVAIDPFLEPEACSVRVTVVGQRILEQGVEHRWRHRCPYIDPIRIERVGTITTETHHRQMATTQFQLLLQRYEPL